MLADVADIRDAVDGGQTWTGLMRRQGPPLTAGIWADLSYGAGIPVANYYAASPLAAAILESRDGIDLGPVPAAGLTRYLRGVTMLPHAQINNYQIIDVCQFYPFVGGDDGAQDTLPGPQFTRYNGGEGCSVMVVSQGVGLGVSDVRLTYTSCDGTTGLQAIGSVNFAATAGSLGSSFASASGVNVPCGPFLPRANGCRGVRSIQNIEPLSGVGGTAAFVIVKPLLSFGSLLASTAPIEVDTFHERTLRMAEIGPGAYLSMLMQSQAAGAPSVLAEITNVWM
jgi:hypothetical protein